MDLILKQQIIENIQKINSTYTTIVNQSITAVKAIDVYEPTLWMAIMGVIASPLYWNLVCRNEYRNQTWTKFFGTKERACSVFSLSIFCLSLVRDYLFTVAIKHQPHGPAAFPFLAAPEVVAFGYIISTIGAMFVGFSMHALGIHGTYMGDYFRILKTERITGFPFNVVSHPMYYGSTMLFLGTAIWYCSPVGVLLAAWVLMVYFIAGIGFEEPFTNKIYSEAAAKKAD